MSRIADEMVTKVPAVTLGFLDHKNSCHDVGRADGVIGACDLAR
jgi:hypothetical protein